MRCLGIQRDVIKHGNKKHKIQHAGFVEENAKQSGMREGSPGVSKGPDIDFLFLHVGGGKCVLLSCCSLYLTHVFKIACST